MTQKEILCGCGYEVVDAKRVSLPNDNIDVSAFDCAGTVAETHLNPNRENDTYAVELMLFKHGENADG